MSATAGAFSSVSAKRLSRTPIDEERASDEETPNLRVRAELERRHPVRLFAFDSESLPARSEHLHLRTVAQDRRDQRARPARRDARNCRRRASCFALERAGEICDAGRRRAASTIPSACATVDANEVAVAERREFDEPDAVAEPSSRLAATCSEVRVLPTPPEPTSVTSRCCSKSDVISAISVSRPTNDFNCCGKLLGSSLSERKRRKVRGECRARPIDRRCSGRARSRSRCSPRLRSVACGGSEPCTISRRHARDEHLAAVTDRQQARDAIDRRAEVVTVALVGRAGVDRARTRNPSIAEKSSRSERALRVEHCGDGVLRDARTRRRTHRRSS